MFTGIVEEVGVVRDVHENVTGARLEISALRVLEDAQLGASIAVNGCCLTVVSMEKDWWAADAVEETLRRTNLGTLRPGDHVNLERPVRLTDRLGGHLVQGHVDAVGTVASLASAPDGSTYFRVALPPEQLRYIVLKGSITVDGVSLTVAGLDDEGFTVALIPHTQGETTLGSRSVGELVNVEVDLLAKYVERLVGPLARIGAAGPASEGDEGCHSHL